MLKIKKKEKKESMNRRTWFHELEYLQHNLIDSTNKCTLYSKITC